MGCYIIPTPGGLNAAETFNCTPTSQAGAAQSEGTAQGGVKTPAAERHDDEGSTLCYNNGTPGLTDGQCETSYWATPGKEVYAFNVPGSASEYACCDKPCAIECYIIPTPGGLNPGETFDCTPTSRAGAAASEVSSPGSEKTPAAGKADKIAAQCYNNG